MCIRDRMVLSRNLNKEIERQCDPYLQDKQYVLPLYDSVKQERLTYLVNKGQLLGQDGMRLKLAINKALHAVNNAQAVSYTHLNVKFIINGRNVTITSVMK